MLKRTIVATAVAVLSLAGVSAEESATFTLRSGERLTGQLVDMGAAGFRIRVSGQERTISLNDMALIDFASSSMSAGDWDRLSSGQHVIWLRNGQVVTGQLTDVGGTSPLRITVNTGGSERDLTSSEVSRIALARPTDTGTGSTGSTGTSGSGQIAVSARNQWTPTGITVRRGETLTFSAEGEIRISSNADDRATASGVVSQRFDPGAPMPRTLVGALIGRIGNGQPFGIGTSNSFPAPDAGQLFLGINDSNVSDNDGSFQVTVQRGGRTRR